MIGLVGRKLIRDPRLPTRTLAREGLGLVRTLAAQVLCIPDGVVQRLALGGSQACWLRIVLEPGVATISIYEAEIHSVIMRDSPRQVRPYRQRFGNDIPLEAIVSSGCIGEYQSEYVPPGPFGVLVA